MIGLYFDDDSGELAVLRGLEREGIDAIRSVDAGTESAADAEHLAYATRADRVLVTANRGDFMRIHSDWMAEGREHAGIIIAEQRFGIGERLRRLTRLVRTVDAEQMRNRIEFLGAWGGGE